MPFKRFNPCLPCCCYRTILVICVYDESSPVYISAGSTYSLDKGVWDEFLEGVTQSHIRVGLMVPQGFEANMHPTAEPYPKDTDREIWDITYLTTQFPRVKQQDILDFFEVIRTNPEPLGGDNGPDLLLFCLDNSGSILTSQYASELAAAKGSLKELWPKMKILDDVSNAGERYLNDTYNGTKNRTCG